MRRLLLVQLDWVRARYGHAVWRGMREALTMIEASSASTYDPPHMPHATNPRPATQPSSKGRTIKNYAPIATTEFRRVKTLMLPLNPLRQPGHPMHGQLISWLLSTVAERGILRY